jgi:HAMP domain-containing protein
VDTAGRNAGRTDLAWHLIREQLSATPLGDAVRGSVRSAEEQFLSSFDPLQQTLLGSLRGRAWSAITPDQWSTVAGQALSRIAEMQRQLLASSRNRLDAELVRAWRSVVFWSLLLLTGSAAVMASTLVVRNRVVLPLEALSSSMLRLAENDLATPLPRVERSDEIGEMSDALRVFKANALRRQRLEQDKQVLHTRLRDAYGQLRKDLEAAAVIQTTMLPEASEVGHVRFRGLYRPSSLIAGDTYNVIERKDGTIGFFQLDVAGHGAPAALMSVASHHALSQALLKQVEGMDLTDLAQQINGEWSGDLPYFTMILGEIDPQAHRATIIQAGHPSPLLIRGDGSVRLMGDGGFPIGLFPASHLRTALLHLRAARPAAALFRWPRRCREPERRALLGRASPHADAGARPHADAVAARRSRCRAAGLEAVRDTR